MPLGAHPTQTKIAPVSRANRPSRHGRADKEEIPMADFQFQKLFEMGADETAYRQLDATVTTTELDGQTILKIDGQTLSVLAAEAIRDVSHLFRSGHLEQLAAILEDREASDNDRFVALELLKNAAVSAGMVLPSCQDTGTAIVIGKKGQHVITTESDEASLARGIQDTYEHSNLRYSQMAPLTMYEEKNTGTNLPAQIELYAVDGDEYHFMFITKGGGSANKSFLFQETRALLNPESLLEFFGEKIRMLGTAACPPYHLAVVIGGTSAENTLKTVKLASTRYLDSLPTTGNELGRAFRDLELEESLHELTRKTGIGAQFGGKYFCHDVRVIRLPRHGASCPVGIGVSCSADRQILGKITREGVFLEQLETDPARFLPETESFELTEDVVSVDLNQPMSEIRKQLSEYPVTTQLSLTGTLIVARDIAHAKLKERIDRGEGLPQYFKDHMVYYAGPAKTPEGHASGSFGPTTAGRMDSYVALFMEHGGSFITLAKGNRSKQVTDACQQYGGFYLGSIGGPAAILAERCIKKVEQLEYPELGMEAIWKIEVENFPAFIVVDDKGNDFFGRL
jgi:fumarate hydratase class I